MIKIRVEADDVANVRFASDPVWELGAALFAAAQPNAHGVHRRLRGGIATPLEPGGPSLWDLTRIPGWTPDVLAPQPRTSPMSVEAALSRIRETDVAVAAGDQRVIRRHLPRSQLGSMPPDTFLDQVSELLGTFWRASLASVWERVEGVARQDIIANQRCLARGDSRGRSGRSTLGCATRSPS